MAEPKKFGSKFVAALGLSHEVVLEGIGIVTRPGDFKHDFEILVDGQRYTHVGEDNKGRWIYRSH